MADSSLQKAAMCYFVILHTFQLLPPYLGPDQFNSWFSMTRARQFQTITITQKYFCGANCQLFKVSIFTNKTYSRILCLPKSFRFPHFNQPLSSITSFLAQNSHLCSSVQSQLYYVISFLFQWFHQYCITPLCLKTTVCDASHIVPHRNSKKYSKIVLRILRNWWLYKFKYERTVSRSNINTPAMH